jgi:Na+/phosphate symporter
MEEVETRDFISSIYALGKEIEECHGLLYNVFVSQSIRIADEAEEKIGRIKDASAGLSSEMIESCGEDEKMRPYCTVPSHFERMASNYEIILRALRRKIKDNLLFSDRAISEVNFLLNRLREILSTLSEFILARNTFTAKYLIESEKDLEKMASEYATLHEERLIEGTCLPRSSGVYIMILDSVKRIAWNVRAIAEKLVR